ncbi:glycine cleavage system aminomethyltransferase GcvT [bacterium]|nr:MAG: glycine cleavage system aminomethyltransferase GcvT [bacterium]RKZ24046.1 MAG: glycine cleavage system aminomethyltransferase GcvT [bacterium]
MAKRTPLYEKHLEYGAKIVEFAGFLMPIQYTGIIDEVLRVRKGVGVFDVSHMGEIEIKGPDALEFVNYITTNDASKLELFQVQYSAMCYPDGGIVDDLLVYRLPDKFLLVVNAANTEKDYEWIKENKRGNVEIENTSDRTFQLAIQGPLSERVMKKLVKEPIEELGYYRATEVEIEGKKYLLSRTGYTGEDGFELYGDPEEACKIWDRIMELGKDENIGPCGLGARDTLRLEMKYCLYGNDITRDTTPLEAGLSWITKFNKGDFIGREALLRQKEEGIKRKLVGFEMKGKGIPRHGYAIYKGDERIGEVTSGTYSPTLEKGIGMGYVRIEDSKPGTEIEVDIRGRREPAVIIKPPFWKNASHK